MFSKAPAFAASNVLDKSRDTYWAAAEGAKQATLNIDLGKSSTLNRLLKSTLR